MEVPQMASIETRPNKDGSISYRITVSLGRDADGKKIFKKTTFTPTSKAPTKAEKELAAFVAQYESQVLNGDVVVSEKATFSDMVQIWEKNWLPAKTPSVQQTYKNVLQVHVLPYIGHMKLTAIKASHIDKILKDEQDAGRTPATVRRTFTTVNSVLEYAFKKQYVRENVCARCDDLEPGELIRGEDIQCFNEKQADRFLHDALVREYEYTYGARQRTGKDGKKYTVAGYKSKRTIPLLWRTYFTMAIKNGPRRGEMLALTWKNFDEKKNMLYIRKSMAAVKGSQYLKAPKTKAGIRDLPVGAELAQLLKELKQEQLLQSMKMGTAWQGHRTQKNPDGTMDSFDDNYIFTQENGLPLSLTTPGHKFDEILAMYNAAVDEDDQLPVIRLHDLRHTFATICLSKGISVYIVSKLLGHSKVSVTMDIYGHLLPDDARSAIDAMEQLG